MANKSRRAKGATKRSGSKKQEVPIKGGDTMPEIFDSSRANAMAEINESATMRQRDLVKAYSNAQKQEPMQPESVVTRPTATEATNVDLPAINPTVEERASVIKESEHAAQGRTDKDEMPA